MPSILGKPLLILFAILALVTAFSGYTAWIYQKGINSERVACAEEKAKALKAAEEINQSIRTKKKAIKHENQSLDRNAIVRKLCDNGWVRNPDHCPSN